MSNIEWRRARAEVINLASVYCVHVGGVPTCRERARVRIGRDLVYVCRSIRVVRAVDRSCHVCKVAHVLAAQKLVAITRVQ